MVTASPVSSAHRRLSLVSPASALPDVGDTEAEESVAPRFAAILVSSRGGQIYSVDWLSLCYQVAERVEQSADDGALLDLGSHEECEAVAMMHTLIQRLTRLGLQAQVGVGPNLCLAQFAMMTASAHATPALIRQAEVAGLLYRAPVAFLMRLRPAGSVTTEDIKRLDLDGLRTCGQVARLGELALRRQFGNAKGRFLAAACRGVDLWPLQSTALPERIRLRLRFSEPLPSTHALAEISAFAQRVADRLEQKRRRAQTIRLIGRWERGVVSQGEAHLREPTASPDLLAREMERLFSRWLRSRSLRRHALASRLIEVRLTLSDLRVAVPKQLPLWPASNQSSAQRRATVVALADALTKQHGHPILLTARLSRPDAIFPGDRYQLVPLIRETAEISLTTAPHDPFASTPPREDPRRVALPLMRWWK